MSLQPQLGIDYTMRSLMTLELKPFYTAASIALCALALMAGPALAAPKKPDKSTVAMSPPQLALVPAPATDKPADQTAEVPANPVNQHIVDLLIRSYQDETNFEALTEALGY